MITLNHLVRRNRDVSAESFRDYWLDTHANACAALAPALGIRKFTACETMHGDEVNKTLQQIYNTAADSYDFIDQMVINDLAVFKQGMAEADTVAALKSLFESSVEFIDVARSDYWFSIELPQVFPGDPCRATWENTLLKVFYVPRHHARLSLQQAQLHWNSCHGAMAREFVEFLPYVKYVQGHRIESKVCDEMKRTLGAEFENIDLMIGQAEAWIDRRVLPSLQGPEVERMMGMLVEDIALFVESTVSHIFATKEHVFLDQPLLVGKVPALFDAD